MKASAITGFHVVDRVVFIRFERAPFREDVATFESLLKTASATNGGKPLICVAAVESRAKIPDATERANLNALMTMIRNYLEVCFLIFEGPELQSNLQRVIMSGVLILTRTNDGFLHMVKNIDAGASELSQRLGKDATPFIKEARERGLVS